MTSTSTTRADTGPNEDHSTDRQTAHLRAGNLIAKLVEHDPSMPLGAAQVLIYLYGYRHRPGGVSLRKLREDLGMTSTIATRSIYYWAEDSISVQIDPQDRRGRT